MLLKIALIDDDESCTLRLKEMLEIYAKENGENFHIDTFSYGIDFISEYSSTYDLIFMDIDMPHMNGLKTAKLLRKVDDKVPLIFVTHLMKYAIKGYEVDASDFIIKPIEYESLSVKLRKVLSKIKERDEAYLLVSSRIGKMKVYYSDIYYITVLQRYVMLHTKKGDMEMRVSMKDLELQLQGTSFVRGDNSSMVNLMHVTEVNQEGAVINGQVIPSSRNRRKALMDAFTLYTR